VSPHIAMKPKPECDHDCEEHDSGDDQCSEKAWRCPHAAASVVRHGGVLGAGHRELHAQTLALASPAPVIESRKQGSEMA
jgi:hypothetical protein